jgi:hypothetical protein
MLAGFPRPSTSDVYFKILASSGHAGHKCSTRKDQMAERIRRSGNGTGRGHFGRKRNILPKIMSSRYQFVFL